MNESDSQSRLDDIADEFLQRLRRGESPSITQYQSDNPELAEQIGSVLKTIQFVDSVRDDTVGVVSPSPFRQNNLLVEGQQLGVYEVLEQIGQGGMGTVLKARHQKMKRLVALKVLSTEGMGSDDVARFGREIEAVGQLSHPNIVSAYDAGEIDGQHFLAMELLDGADLSRVCQACGPMDVGSACELIRQAAVGLQYAHENGMVHRDIKPSNLMLTAEGSVKIMDLGLARLNDQSGQSEITSTGQVMGTIDYIAPEQCSDSHSVDIRADIYSLGATLYKMLSGECPFYSPTRVTTLQKLLAITSGDPPSIRVRRFDLPQELVEIIDRSVSHDPAKRFAQPKEFASALAGFAETSALQSILRKTCSPERPGATQDTAIRPQSLVDTSRTELPGREPAYLQTHVQTHEPGPLVQSQSSRKRFRNIAGVFIALCFFAALPFLLPSIISLKTDDGTIRVETDGGETKFVFDGDQASFQDPTDGKLVTVSIDKASDSLVFAKEGFRSVGKSYEIVTRDKRISLSFVPKEDSKASDAGAELTTKKRADAIRWAVKNGLIEINQSPCGQFAFDSAELIHHIAIYNHQPDQAVKVLTRLASAGIDPEKIDVMGTKSPDQILYKQLETHVRLRKLGFHCPCDLNAIEQMPATLAGRLTEFSLMNPYKPPTDDMIECVARRCSRLTEMLLMSNELSSNAVKSISELAVGTATFISPTHELQQNLSSLKKIHTLSLVKSATQQKLDLAHLPPNLHSLWVSGQDLGVDELDDLDRYKKLRFLSLDGSKLDSVAAKRFRESHPTCEIRNYFDEKEEDVPSPIEWAFANGLTHLEYKSKNGTFSLNAPKGLSGAKNIYFTQAHFDHTEATPVAIAKLNSYAPLMSVRLVGSRPVDNPMLRQLAQVPSLKGLSFYCPFTSTQLASLPRSTRDRLTTLSLLCDTRECRLTDEKLHQIVSVFPNVNILRAPCTKLTKKALGTIQAMSLTDLTLTHPTRPILENLNLLTKVRRLQLSFADTVYDPATKLKLPQGLQILWFDDIAIEKEHFDVFEECLSLDVLTPRGNGRIDFDALAHFKKQRPDVTVDLSNSRATIPIQAPLDKRDKSELAAALQWAFQNGLEGFTESESAHYISKAADTPDDLQQIHRLQIRSIRAGEVTDILAKILPLAQPQALHLYGNQMLIPSSIEQIASLTGLKELRISCPCVVDQLKKLPPEFFKQLTVFGLNHSDSNSQITDSFVLWLTKSSLQLRQLRISGHLLSRNAITSLSQIPLREFECFNPSDDVLRTLNQMVTVENLLIYSHAQGAKSLEFAYLPPKLKMLRIWFVRLDAEDFAKLGEYKDLEMISCGQCDMDMQAALAFVKSHPDVKVQDWKTGKVLVAPASEP